MNPRPLGMETRRAEEPVQVTVLQPLPEGAHPITGTLLGEVWARGALHHYRIRQGCFVLLAPPHWLSPDSHRAVRKAGLTVLKSARVAA